MTHLQFIINAELNDHDGYCSEDDCEYSFQRIRLKVPIPDKYKDKPIGSIITDYDEDLWKNHYKVKLFEDRSTDSQYGGCRYEVTNGLGRHELRCSVVKCFVI